MKTRNFIVGGLIGASAMWLYNKRKHPFMNMMRSMMMSAFKNESPKKQSQLKQNESSHTKQENESLIRSIIEHDPTLQKQFNDITQQAHIEKPNSAMNTANHLQ